MADKPQYGRIGYIGLVEVVDNSAMTTKQSSGPTTTNYQLTTKSTNYDKQSGSYMRGTAKESCSSGDYSNHGKVGYKDQYKTSSTVRVGDKTGYTEYYKQEKVTRVEYDTTTTTTSSYSGRNYKNYGGGSKRYINGGGGGGKRYNPYGGGNKYLN